MAIGLVLAAIGGWLLRTLGRIGPSVTSERR
jgi:hypothetical protein